MSSFSSQFDPRANVFLVVNLGCEMLYVIDQRLKAQQIDKSKATQVFHEIASVLLEAKFITSLIQGSTHEHAELITVEHCRLMLNDIVTCSLMRLDDASMDKLWNLMTMIYKWQLFVTKHPHQLLDNTFRHLDSIGKLYATVKHSMLVDSAKHMLLDFWNACAEQPQLAIYRTHKAWLQCFNTKISLLMRLGFQTINGDFIAECDEHYYRQFVDTAGENIYELSAELAMQNRRELLNAAAASNMNVATPRSNIDQLAADILGAHQRPGEMSVQPPQQQHELQMQKCNMLFEDLAVTQEGSRTGAPTGAVLNMSIFPEMSNNRRPQHRDEFVPVETVYNRNAVDAGSSNLGGMATETTHGLNKELLDLYSKMN